jgi:pimeloyl-ACP methyl ester carboxylesterase
MDVHPLVAPIFAAVLVAGCVSGISTNFSTSVVDIGGRRMYMECDGFGSPAVVLISGKGNRADTWSVSASEPQHPETAVFAAVSGFTRVCAYDRPMTVGVDGEPSRSDPAPEPLTAQDAVSDLHALLAQTGLHGPYLLVGHSYGGLVARLFASTYPDAVAGIVLEDALSEGLYDGLTAGQVEILEAINLEPERLDTVRSFAQVRSAPAVRPVPMEILTADLPPISAQDIANGRLPPYVTAEFADALWTAQVAAQSALARLFPYATHITNTDSHHYIHSERPEVVVDAIREVVAAVRAATR